jgi:hypothetical protein
MIGTPCDVGTNAQGTLAVTYTPQADGTDSISWVCQQNTQSNSNPSLAVSINAGQEGSTVCDPTCGQVFGELAVTSSPGSINCSIVVHDTRMPGPPQSGSIYYTQGGACTDQFTQGTTVTLTAVAGTNSSVGSWSGCDSVSADGSTCTVTMNTARSVSATDNYTGP